MRGSSVYVHGNIPVGRKFRLLVARYSDDFIPPAHETEDGQPVPSPQVPQRPLCGLLQARGHGQAPPRLRHGRQPRRVARVVGVGRDDLVPQDADHVLEAGADDAQSPQELGDVGPEALELRGQEGLAVDPGDGGGEDVKPLYEYVCPGVYVDQVAPEGYHEFLVHSPSVVFFLEEGVHCDKRLGVLHGASHMPLNDH